MEAFHNAIFRLLFRPKKISEDGEEPPAQFKNNFRKAGYPLDIMIRDSYSMFSNNDPETMYKKMIYRLNLPAKLPQVSFGIIFHGEHGAMVDTTGKSSHGSQLTKSQKRLKPVKALEIIPRVKNIHFSFLKLFSSASSFREMPTCFNCICHCFAGLMLCIFMKKRKRKQQRRQRKAEKKRMDTSSATSSNLE